ncbi:ATPase family AAA domain-containing protein 1-B-like [Trypanosoma rangeli]|uniref:ATPase family AAA domain-containing protein 1-B-like n=1 Tax=Trypanosoma rangeli TaxID=5698 RepID=A0A3R7KBD2_TRYRA|nr:ATPase family AAA domain-containing protein 1-B-like [Trypanosoma rangeli]RNE97239.1 ATPase family AAA domain-containing protein 1-B-like [Trypanosoma rangeli]|eukprot:RNE97239.1 ATPase family AAA domain-containing protein 1-B-like [Trypanosoma rangeli]
MPSFHMKTVTDCLKSLVSEVVKKLRETPIFFWIYISVLLYMTRKLTYQYGHSKKKLNIRGQSVYVDRAEEAIAECIIDPATIKEDFSNIGGLEDAKLLLIEHVKWPFTRPELFSGKTLRSHPKGVLLYGPPGTGKTLLARAMAKELGCSFINVKTDSLFSKWVGDTEKNAAAVFSLAEKISPCVIFIDEVDALLGSRNTIDSPPHNHAKTIFMTCWDGITQSDAKIIVIGATNRPKFIDEAIRRRLPLQVEVPPPDEAARHKILNILLEHDLGDNPNKNEIIAFVATKTSNYTGSDLTELCKAAALMPVHEISKDGVLPPLESRHFTEALRRVRPSL